MDLNRILRDLKTAQNTLAAATECLRNLAEGRKQPVRPLPVSKRRIDVRGRDFYGWSVQQVEKMRSGEKFDRRHVATEIEQIGRCYEAAWLRDALRDLIEEQIARDDKARRRYANYCNAHSEILDILKRSPSLTPQLPEFLKQVYKSCLQERDLKKRLPKKCPYTLSDLGLPRNYVAVEPEYDQDFYGWAIDQSRRIRAGEQFDVENVTDELRSLGRVKSDRLKRGLAEVMAARLEWQYAPHEKSYSGSLWILAEDTARNHVLETLRANRSLRTELPKLLPAAYSTAVFRATIVLDELDDIFPAKCPWTLADLGLIQLPKL